MCSRSLLFLCLHLFVSPPCSCYFRIHLTRVTVNMSWITKTCPVLLSPSVYNGRDNLTTEKLFGKMGQYNSIVTALYWKQPSWEGSPSLSVSLIFSHSLFPSSLALSLAHSSSFFQFPSSLLSLLISSKQPLRSQRVVLLELSMSVHLCMSVRSSQVGLWDPLYYIDISSCRVCS